MPPRTVGAGRHCAGCAPTRRDDRLHEWRKSVKYLWYQMQLLHDAAPSVLGPLVDRLDLLAEALGDDHDLTVLVELLDARPDDYGTAGDVDHVRTLARRRQHTLRTYAIRSGATIYAEADHAFVHRIAGYWHLTVDHRPRTVRAATRARRHPPAPSWNANASS